MPTCTSPESFTEIHTGLFTSVALEILNSVIGHLSDGRWENSPAMEKYWKFAKIRKNIDDEVLICISRKPSDWNSRHGTCNGFMDMDESQVRKFFADKAKTLVKDEFGKDRSIWSRANTTSKTTYLSYDEDISVAQVYLVYETLKGRSRAPGKYSTEVYMTAVGKPLSKEEVERKKKILKKIEEKQRLVAEAAKKRDEELAKIKAAHEAELAKIKAEFDASVKALDPIS